MTTATAPIEQDERAVEEAHCAECGVPISAIPSWYANVAVRFSCDNCRQKSPRLAAAPVPSLDADTATVTSGAIDTELDGDAALEDIDVEDIEIDDAELDSEAEVEGE